MPIAVLLFSEMTVEKLAAHAIGPEEVRQVSDGDRVVIANPCPRLRELELRAAAEGTDLNAAAAGALRVGAHAT